MSLKYLEDIAREIMEELEEVHGTLYSENLERNIDAEDILEVLSLIEAGKAVNKLFEEENDDT